MIIPNFNHLSIFKQIIKFNLYLLSHFLTSPNPPFPNSIPSLKSNSSSNYSFVLKSYILLFY